jgi:hypothetical protein
MMHAEKNTAVIFFIEMCFFRGDGMSRVFGFKDLLMYGRASSRAA